MKPIADRSTDWLVPFLLIPLFPFAFLTLPFPIFNLLALVANSAFWGWVFYYWVRRKSAANKI